LFETVLRRSKSIAILHIQSAIIAPPASSVPRNASCGSERALRWLSLPDNVAPSRDSVLWHKRRAEPGNRIRSNKEV
jgi:hypothetical protein